MHFLSDYSYLTTSDHVRSHVLMNSFRSSRRDFFYPYASEETTALDTGGSAYISTGNSGLEQYKGLRILGLVGFKVTNDALIDVTAGLHFFNHSGLNYVETVGEIKAYASAFDVLTGYLSLGHDYAYVLGFMPGAVTSNLKSTNIGIYVNFRPGDFFMMNYQQQTNIISDGNTRSDLNIDAMYGFSPDDPWIWGGLGLGYLTFDQVTTEYWSPASVISFGPKFDTSFAFVGNIIRVNAAFDYTYSYEKESDTSGGGYKLALSLALGERNSAHGSIFFNRVVQNHSGIMWNSNEIGAQVNLFL